MRKAVKTSGRSFLIGCFKKDESKKSSVIFRSVTPYTNAVTKPENGLFPAASFSSESKTKLEYAWFLSILFKMRNAVWRSFINEFNPFCCAQAKADAAG